MTLSSVVFPAPLAPTTPNTVPRFSEKDTSRSAHNSFLPSKACGYIFPTPRTSSTVTATAPTDAEVLGPESLPQS